jgi:PAS domain S-box-containing protein
MDDSSKTREQLLAELHTFRQRLMMLETLAAERQQYAEALRESQARYALAVQAGQVGVWDWDIISSVIYLDPMLKAMLGYRDDEIPNHLDDWSRRVHPDDLAAVMTAAHAALAGQTPHYEIEHRMLHKDGSIRWFLARGTVLRDATGSPYRLIGTDTNITTRKQAEAALQQAYAHLERQVAWRTAELQRINAQLRREIAERQQAEAILRQSEERYRTLVESSLQGISITWSGKRLFANRAFARILGYDDPQELVGQDVRNHIAPHEWERLRRHAQARLRGEPVPSRYEFQGVRKDGTLIWLETAVSLVTWEGKLARLATVLDITDRKQLEHHFRQSQKMAAMGTLAGGIAHDFNNILSAILGFADLTRNEVRQDSVAWFHLQEVLKAGRRAKNLVQQILAFSRQTATTRQPLCLPALLGEILPLLRALLPTSIAIQSHVAQDVGPVLADPTQMHQVLLNLCSNAEFAMRTTGGTLTLGVDVVDVDEAGIAQHPTLRPGPHVRLTVQDTGHGMDATTLERIFEPFYTTKEVGEGTGMGLAVVHGIVTSHGGMITVESTPGQGSIFTIYLPRLTATAERQASVEETVPPGHGSVLFVDDEEVLARLGQELLQRLGYEVVSSTSSVQALALFQSMPQHFDLVVTDQTMPQMTGERLAQELRRIRPDLPIILCTGFSHVMNAAKAQALGIDAFCMKPLVAQELALTIQQVLAHRAKRKTAARHGSSAGCGQDAQREA